MQGKVRIIAGEYRGRRLSVPPLEGVRPTPDRVRETLFNWLGQWLDGLSCLDLFAGSGALGFEAASRGAKRVVMVERDAKISASLEQAKAQLGAAQVELVRREALEYLQGAGERFDVVFLDPPFGQNALPALLERLPAALAPAARVYVEGPRPPEEKPGFTALKRSRAGQVHYALFQWQATTEGR